MSGFVLVLAFVCACAATAFLGGTVGGITTWGRRRGMRASPWATAGRDGR